MRWSDLPPNNPNLDMDRHIRQLVREVLPIFLTVLLIIGLAILFFWPKNGIELAKPLVRSDFERDRVGLLLAKENAPFDTRYAIVSPLERARAPVATRIDAPLGSEHGAFTYNAQPFLTSRHLGDDLNGIGGWNSDLGDPVFSIGEGEVIYAGWPSDGWGNVVVVQHRLNDGRMIESFYGHLDQIDLPVGYRIRRGEKLGTVGTANGTYLAHLHFEIREHGTFDAGAGYADTPMGRLPGELFLQKNRSVPEPLLNTAIRANETGPPESSLDVEIKSEPP